MKKTKSSPTPITDSLAAEHTFVDNELADALKEIPVHSKLGVSKRSGDSVRQIVFALVVWPLLAADTLRSFCGRLIGAYMQGGAGVLYSFLGRPDINWDRTSAAVAKQVYLAGGFGAPDSCAFVCDDTLKERRGKKVQATSKHYDHNSGRHIIGHQVVQLGLAGPKGFLPLEQQIYTGTEDAREAEKPFCDRRRAASRDYWEALLKTKNEMLRGMLKRARRLGFQARWLVADAWFGNKGNIAAALGIPGLAAVFQMRRGNLKYRYRGQDYTAAGLYALVRHKLAKRTGERFCTCMLLAELNLEEDPKKPARYAPVKLVFSRPADAADNDKAWVLFLCSDTSRTVAQILEAYSLRWSVEVYFKEVKQNMGFLKEQTGRYTTHYASVNLASIRYCLILHLLLSRGGPSYGSVRDKVTGQLEALSFAAMLWHLFRALIHGALDRFLERVDRGLLDEIKNCIDSTVEDFLLAALQMDPGSIKALERAEAAGAIE